MTDAAVAGSEAKISSRWFYAWMAMTCFVIALLGFMPTYFVPMVQGKLASPPLVHAHGIILFSWMTLFVTQTWLVAKGGVLAHRTWGMLGIAIMTGIMFVVTAIVSWRVSQTYAPGIPAELGLAVKKFMWVPFSGLLLLAPMFVLAILNIKKPEVHKRLMLLLTISMLGAPIARWFLVFLAPPPDPTAPVILLPNGAPAPLVPPVEIAVPPALIGDVLWVIAMVYDWRTRGKVHPVYLIGGGVMLLNHLTYVPIANSAAWVGFADWLGRLAG